MSEQQMQQRTDNQQDLGARVANLARVNVLEKSFRQFALASEKLEMRYADLQRETERLREELKAKDLEVKRAEQLAVLGKMAAAIAHEVRNPLGAMKLFVSLLRKDLSDRPSARELVDHIDQGVVNLDNVVSNILQFARGQSLQFGPVNLHVLIEEQLAEVLRSQLNVNQQIETDLRFLANPFVVANAHSLRQVFRNVFLNSVQAMKYQGRLSVLSENNDNERVKITVRDNGPGIPIELLSKVFEPFVSNKNEGTGLGLAVVKQIIQHHGGEVSVLNREGAELCILLPRNPERLVSI